MPDSVQYRNFYAMGTRLDLVMVGPDDKKADRITGMVRSVVEDIENLLSIYKPESELSRLNSEASKREVVVSEDLFCYLKIIFAWA